MCHFITVVVFRAWSKLLGLVNPFEYICLIPTILLSVIARRLSEPTRTLFAVPATSLEDERM